MKTPTQSLFTLLLLTLVGCSTSQKTAPRVHSHGPVAETALVEVPLPASTPFDDSGHARTVYLRGYQEGYRSDMPAALNPHARVGAADPRARGWHDGAFAARVAKAMTTTKGGETDD